MRDLDVEDADAASACLHVVPPRATKIRRLRAVVVLLAAIMVSTVRLQPAFSEVVSPTAAPPFLATETEMAGDVLLGKSKKLTYGQAVLLLQKAARSGDVRAQRLESVTWMTPLPHPEHQISYVNAYFGARRNKETEPDLDYSWLTDPDIFKEVDDINKKMGISYQEHGDEISDEMQCTLTLEAVDGIFFGFDNNGVYVQGSPGTSLSSYSRFALRVDSNKAYMGTIPDAIARLNKDRGILARSAVAKVISMSEAKAQARELEKLVPRTAPVYVAHVGSEEFETLLRQLSLGDTVRARVILADGTERTVSWSLTFTFPDGSLPTVSQTANILDLPAYRYVNCVLGRLR